MTTEDLLIDYSSYGKTVETVRKSLPKFNVVPGKNTEV